MDFSIFLACQVDIAKPFFLSLLFITLDWQSARLENSSDSMDIDEADRSKLSEVAEKELTRLWRTWRTVNEMLMDRV